MSSGKAAAAVLMAVALLSLGACGENPAPQTNTPIKPKAAPPSAAQREAAKQLEGMTAAVKLDAGAALTAVKFQLKARPELNKPLTIRIAYISSTGLESLNATYTADQGLTVGTAQTLAEFSKLEPGMPYFHEVSVTPKANGVQYMSAVVQAKGDGAPRMQTFHVPILVGAPPAG